MAKNKIYIPYFISNEQFAPAKVLPRLFFYNGKKDCDIIYVQYYSTGSGLIQADTFTAFPYFDHYSGETTTTSSLSLLFLNEDPVYGTEYPSQSLYDRYWAKYVDLLYNPKTRILRCNAVLPFDVYQNIELNDIVQLRSNYYHLRAINDYNLRTGECRMELLGPILEGSIDNQFPTYYSSFLSASVQKNDCGIGYTGSFVSVTLPASYSVSTQSFQVAQEEAETYFNSITQSVANASGSCILDSGSYSVYNFELGLAWDNNVTTSIYPLTVSFYTTTSLNIPSESSSEWTTIGYFTSSQAFEAGRKSFSVTARKNVGLVNSGSAPYSGSSYNLFKVRGANGEKIGTEPTYTWNTAGLPLSSVDVAPYWYNPLFWTNNTGSQATASRDIQSKPHLSNDYTQSLRLPGEFSFNFINGFSAGDFITGSVPGPLTMSWLVTSSTTFPSISDPKWTVFAIVEPTMSADAGILTQITGSSVYYSASNEMVLGTSSLYTTSNQVYYFKVEDASGSRPNWRDASRTSNVNPTLTRTYNNYPNTDMVSFRVTDTGSITNDSGQTIYLRRP